MSLLSLRSFKLKKPEPQLYLSWASSLISCPLSSQRTSGSGSPPYLMSYLITWFFLMTKLVRPSPLMKGLTESKKKKKTQRLSSPRSPQYSLKFFIHTESALGDNRLSRITGFTRTSLIDGTYSKFVLSAFFESIDCARSHISLDFLAFHPVLAEFLLQTKRGQ